MKLTDAQAKALRALSAVESMSSAEIGYLFSKKQHANAQGAGRIGGTMAHRLMRAGLVWHHDTKISGRWRQRGYEITHAGREALREHDAGRAALQRERGA